MRRVERDGLAWYEFDGPDSHFKHALITRMGGVSAAPFASLNLGSTVGDAPAAVAENHRRLFSALNVTPECVVSPHQVHGRNVAQVHLADGGTVIPETDALITNVPGVVLLLRFADCTPVLLYDPVQQAVGLAHGGWRGVAGGIVPATVQAMHTAFGSDVRDLWVGVGPAIGPDHYEVGAEVVAAIAATLPPGTNIARRHHARWLLDLPTAIEAQLTALGVQHSAQSGLCTACHTDEWYSHRREKGHTGRFGVLVSLR